MFIVLYILEIEFSTIYAFTLCLFVRHLSHYRNRNALSMTVFLEEGSNIL